MIGALTGRIFDRPEPGKIVIDVQGVGYDVETSLHTFFQLESIQDKISLHIHTVVREDALLLYGFMEKQERALFRALIKVNGVGPKMAMNILSSTTPFDFIQSIHSKQTDSLMRLPGIGKKTAERLLIEMKDKLDMLPTSDNVVFSPETPSIQTEAMHALEALGYKPQEATRMIKSIDDGSFSSCEGLIRAALRATV